MSDLQHVSREVLLSEYEKLRTENEQLRSQLTAATKQIEVAKRDSERLICYVPSKGLVVVDDYGINFTQEIGWASEAKFEHWNKIIKERPMLFPAYQLMIKFDAAMESTRQGGGE